MSKPAPLEEAVTCVQECWDTCDSDLIVGMLRDVHRSALLKAARMASARATFVGYLCPFSGTRKRCGSGWIHKCARCLFLRLASDPRKLAEGEA